METNDYEIAEVEEYKFDLGYCKRQIKSWKRWYMRKNSKYPAMIQLRCHCPGIESRFWKYFIELWINGKMKDQTLITPEAYDTFDYDKSRKKVEMKNLVFIELEKFVPIQKTTDNTKN